jgi:hypothetical protein
VVVVVAVEVLQLAEEPTKCPPVAASHSTPASCESGEPLFALRCHRKATWPLSHTAGVLVMASTVVKTWRKLVLHSMFKGNTSFTFGTKEESARCTRDVPRDPSSSQWPIASPREAYSSVPTYLTCGTTWALASQKLLWAGHVARILKSRLLPPQEARARALVGAPTEPLWWLR